MTLSITDSLEQFIREAVQRFDSEIDTSAGSKFDRLVTQPIMARLGPDPTDTDAIQVVLDRLRFYDPNISTEPGTGIRDVLVNPISTILEPFRLVAKTIVSRSSWKNVESMSEEEADRLADGVFKSRDEGAKASGSLRLKFGSPRNVLVSPANVARAGDLRFLPSRTQTISSSRMATQISGSYYYFDIELIAEKAGTEYEVEPGSIISIEGVSGLVGVVQLSKFSPGRDRQTNLELKAASQDSITIRNLSTERSIRTVLPDFEHFPSLDGPALVVVGRNDPLMLRDLLLGATNISGIPLGVKGATSPALAVNESVHLGGFTDVWMRTTSTQGDVQEILDIKNLFDEGALVYHADTGSVTTADPEILHDERAFFTGQDRGFLPVLPGDILIVQGVLDVDNAHREFTIDSPVSSPTELTVTEPGGISALVDLPNVSYEVRRRRSGYITVSLDTLAAEEEGETLVDTNGDALLPVPGRRLLPEAVASTKNKASGNASLPLVRINTIELLDPISNQPTGEVVPEADPITWFISDRVSSTKVLVRVLWRHPTAFATLINPTGGSVTPTSLYTLDASTIYVPASLSGSAVGIPDGGGDSAVVEISGAEVTTPFASEYPSRTPQVGDFIAVVIGGQNRQGWIVETSVDGIPNRYRIDQEVIPVGAPGFGVITQGTLAAGMTNTDEFGFFYTDIVATRSVGTIDVLGTPLATPLGAIASQGWRIYPRLDAFSFSVFEEPLLEISNLVNDDTDMTAVGTGIRITYVTTPILKDVQSFLDSDEERLPAEDMLARRLPLALVHVSLRYVPDPVTSAPLTNSAAQSLLEAIQEEGAITATRMSNVIEELGASKVTYPFASIVEYEGYSRTGHAGLGRLLAFRGLDGAVVPTDLAPESVEVYRIADFKPGTVLVSSVARDGTITTSNPGGSEVGGGGMGIPSGEPTIS